MDDIDEESLRAEAMRLYVPLEHEEELERSKRRWLERNWPETTAKNASYKPAEEYEKCISQSFLRDTEDKDGTLLRHVVKTATDELYANEIPVETLDNLLENLDQMSDMEVVRAIPGIKTLPFTVSRCLYQLLTGKRNKNGDWMQVVVLNKLESIDEEEETAREVAEVFRRLKQKPLCKVRGHVGTYNVVLPEGCTFLQAAETILMNPGDLPQRCLRAMLDLVHSKPFEVKQLNASGSNREELTKRLRKQAQVCIEEARTGGNVAPLQKALRVVMFFTQIIGGDDGGLSELLATPPAATDMLQRRLLFSMFQVDKLNMNDMEAVYHTLLKDAEKKCGSRHPRIYYETIKVLFESALYRCNSDNIPEYIVQGLDMVAAAKPQAKFKSGTTNLRRQGRSVVAETETLFDLSSSLEHVLWEWMENFPFEIEASEEPAQVPEKEEEAESSDDEDYLMSYTFDKLETERQIQEVKPKAQDVETDEATEKKLTAVADEAAALAYVVVGRAMEESLRGSGDLDPESKRYLRSVGLVGDVDITDSTIEDPEEILMRVLRGIPSLPPSVLENVTVRLQKLQEEDSS